MKREKGIARCGLACCLCTENATCGGCRDCPEHAWCENLRCSTEKGIEGCWACNEADCRKGLLGKIKPRVFTAFVRTEGKQALMDCLERNEQRGVVYHRSGVIGDYDDFDDEEALRHFIRTGQR